MENMTTHRVRIQSRSVQNGTCWCFIVDAGVNYFWFLYPGAVLVFLPGLAEIKMLYEQLMSNRMFNNRGASRCES